MEEKQPGSFKNVFHMMCRHERSSLCHRVGSEWLTGTFSYRSLWAMFFIALKSSPGFLQSLKSSRHKVGPKDLEDFDIEGSRVKSSSSASWPLAALTSVLVPRMCMTSPKNYLVFRRRIYLSHGAWQWSKTHTAFHFRFSVFNVVNRYFFKKILVTFCHWILMSGMESMVNDLLLFPSVFFPL